MLGIRILRMLNQKQTDVEKLLLLTYISLIIFIVFGFFFNHPNIFKKFIEAVIQRNAQNPQFIS